MSGPRRIGVVIPMRDEREAVRPLLEKFAALIESSPDDYRIVVVDGASRDGTADEVRRFAGRLPIEVIVLVDDAGLGGALETGLRTLVADAGITAIVTMDGDDSHDPHAIPALVERLDQGFDVVIASRFVAGGQEVGVAPHRRVLSHAASRLLHGLFPMGEVRDYSSGFRAYRPAALVRVRTANGWLVEERGFACMLELLLKLRRGGARAAEVPLVLRYDLKRGRSKMQIAPTVVRYLKLMRENVAFRAVR